MACGHEAVVEEWDPFIPQKVGVPDFEQIPAGLSFETFLDKLGRKEYSLLISVPK